jgi:hypothetical protein
MIEDKNQIINDKKYQLNNNEVNQKVEQSSQTLVLPDITIRKSIKQKDTEIKYLDMIKCEEIPIVNNKD